MDIIKYTKHAQTFTKTTTLELKPYSACNMRKQQGKNDKKKCCDETIE